MRHGTKLASLYAFSATLALMGVQFYFVYETDDEAVLEAKAVGCQGLQDLFEIRPDTPNSASPVLNPPFVQHFPKLHEAEVQDIAWDALTQEEADELMEELLKPYVGPTFAPQELVNWANTWLKIIEGLTPAERVKVLPSIPSFWIPVLLKDLRVIKEQGECAHHHNVKMHIEMY